MAAITAATQRNSQGSYTHLETYGMDASAGTIPKGAIVCLDATGYAVNGADTASYVFVGIAVETKTASGSDGNITIAVDCTVGKLWRFTHGTGDAAVTDVGVAMCIADNNTVDDATATSKDIEIGKIAKYISATEVWVRIDFDSPVGAA